MLTCNNILWRPMNPYKTLGRECQTRYVQFFHSIEIHLYVYTIIFCQTSNAVFDS